MLRYHWGLQLLPVLIISGTSSARQVIAGMNRDICQGLVTGKSDTDRSDGDTDESREERIRERESPLDPPH